MSQPGRRLGDLGQSAEGGSAPHFVAHVKAPAPNIIMRRLATSERTVTPALGDTRRTIKSSTTEVQVFEVQIFIAALAKLRNPPAPLGERSRMHPSTPAVDKKRLTLTRN
jgi:hypothetical protein